MTVYLFVTLRSTELEWEEKDCVESTFEPFFRSKLGACVVAKSASLLLLLVWRR